MTRKDLRSPEFIPYYIHDVKKYKLSPTEAIVYWFIRFFFWQSKKEFKWQDKDIAEILGMNKWTVGNCMSKLQKKWAIICDTKKYMVWSVRAVLLTTSSFREQHLTKWWGATSSNDEVLGNETVTSNKRKDKRKDKETISSFSEFRDHYPRKISKKKAEASYTSALKNKTPPWKILDWLKRYTSEILKNWTQKKYIAHPSTRLNQERWNDEYDSIEFGSVWEEMFFYYKVAKDANKLEELKKEHWARTLVQRQCMNTDLITNKYDHLIS